VRGEQALGDARPFSVAAGDSESIRIAFQGAHGAFSESALFRYFENASRSVEAISRPVFRDVFQSVLDGSVEFGIVPLENSLMGSIHENYDLLLQFPDLMIVGETHIRIEHSLIGVPGATIDDIATVISQGPGIEQCRTFLDGHPDWSVEPFYDTAGAVERVRDLGDKTLAAIAHASAAAHYGMTVLKEGIETNPRNYTRFAILSRGASMERGAADMATLVFSTPDKPGALFEAMRVLADNNTNMKKLESRPIQGEPWRYMFYLDVEMPTAPGAFDQVLDALETETRGLRVLGRYRSSRGFGA
jgi:prephenate dehydratase